MTARTASRTAALLLFLAGIQAAMCNISPEPKNFFGSINGNLTKIVWAHAVNSQAALEKALASADVMMLEADVVVGKLNGTVNGTDVPIMAHPPANQSDLSLEEFLRTVAEKKNASKGVKLDFKSSRAFDLSKPIIRNAQKNLTFPVFLNADILAGPVNASAPTVDAKQFLAGAAEVLPESTLSVGWTTRFGQKENISEGRYTKADVKAMQTILQENKVKQPVTYPVRASLVSGDIEAVKALLDDKNSGVKNATLTLWTGDGDTVNVEQLSKLIRDVGVHRVYVDLPEEIRSKLDFSGASGLGATLLVSLGPMILTILLSRIL